MRLWSCMEQSKNAVTNIIMVTPEAFPVTVLISVISLQKKLIKPENYYKVRWHSLPKKLHTWLNVRAVRDQFDAKLIKYSVFVLLCHCLRSYQMCGQILSQHAKKRALAFHADGFHISLWKPSNSYSLSGHTFKNVNHLIQLKGKVITSFQSLKWPQTNCTQFPTLLLVTVFHALSHGVIHFVRSLHSSFTPWNESFWLAFQNTNQWESNFSN